MEKTLEIPASEKERIEWLYHLFGNKLCAYSIKNYQLQQDDAWNITYKTLYKIAAVANDYSFENAQKLNAFVFKTHINYLRNFYRDTKKNPLLIYPDTIPDTHQSEEIVESPELKLINRVLDEMEDWERILLLMRAQDVAYSEIANYIDKPEKQLKVYYKRLKEKLENRLHQLSNSK